MDKIKEVKKAVCLSCPLSCAVLVNIENGRVISINGNPEGISRGFVCEKSKAAIEVLYHEDRLNYPLKRAGERGEGRWERIPWEKALDEVAERLMKIKKEDGPEAIAHSQGTYRTTSYVGRRFMNLLGSPNVLASGTQVCFCNVTVIESITYGRKVHMSDYDHTQCMVQWAANPSHSRPFVWPIIVRNKRRGAKLIVIDSRYTKTASIADLWLQPRPGTDTALLMGWMHIIINEKLYDKDFVKNWTIGFEELKKRVQKYPPKKVSEITQVPEDKIRDAVIMYTANRPACMDWAVAFDKYGKNSTHAVRARAILRAITGNIDVKGGDLLAGPHPKIISETEIEENERLSTKQREKQLGADRFRLFTWDTHDKMLKYAKKIGYRTTHNSTDAVKCHAPSTWRAIITGRPYPVKAMLTVANNPIIANANSRLVYEAIKKLDLYVVKDFWLTPSAELADFVFPTAMWIERPWLDTHSSAAPHVHAGERAIKPLYERRTDFEFFRELGIRMGQDWPWKTAEQLFEYQLSPLNYTWDQFASKIHHDFPPIEYRKYEKTGFATPSGKVEIYSSILEELGYDPLPEYEEPAEGPMCTPDLLKEYPFTLINGGKIRTMFHTEGRQIESMRKFHPDPLVQINPDVATEYGIADGDWVWIETRMGKIRQRAKLFSGIDPNVIHAEHGWWFPEMPGEEPILHGAWESNVNVLTDDDPAKCDPMVGGWQLGSMLCKIYRDDRIENRSV